MWEESRKAGQQLLSCHCRPQLPPRGTPLLSSLPSSTFLLLLHLAAQVLIDLQTQNLNLKLGISSPPSAPRSCSPFTLQLKIFNLKSLDLKLRIYCTPSLPSAHSFCTFLLLKNQDLKLLLSSRSSSTLPSRT